VSDGNIVRIVPSGMRPVYGWQIDSSLKPEDDPNGPAWEIVGYARSPWEASSKNGHKIPWPHGGHVIPWREGDGRESETQAKVEASRKGCFEARPFGGSGSQEDRRPNRVNPLQENASEPGNRHNRPDNVTASAAGAGTAKTAQPVEGEARQSGAQSADAQTTPSENPS